MAGRPFSNLEFCPTHSRGPTGEPQDLRPSRGAFVARPFGVRRLVNARRTDQHSGRTMFPAPHVDDAVAFVVEKLKGNPNGYINGNNPTYDVWLPSLVWQYLPTIGCQPNQGEFQQDPALEDNLAGVLRRSVAAVSPRRFTPHRFLGRLHGSGNASGWQRLLIYIQWASMAQNIRSSICPKRSRSLCCATL
jgi:hypothetical protein